jgi:hypothetical protein
MTTKDVPLGNFPLLFFEDFYCTGLFFMVQGPDFASGADPVEGLVGGASSTWPLEFVVPAAPLEVGKLVIDEPLGLKKEFIPANSLNQHLNATTDHRFGSSGGCDNVEPNCAALGDCLGRRLWEVDAFEAELRVVDDGGVEGDPTLACGPLLNDMAGKIAIGRRGVCPFADKALFGQEADALALVLVNDGRCSGYPASDNCIINMDAGSIGPIVDMPIILVSVNDGEPLIAELEGGGTVRATAGAVPSWSFKLDSDSFQTALETRDANIANDDDIHQVWVAPLLFEGGFESGDTSAWSVTVP